MPSLLHRCRDLVRRTGFDVARFPAPTTLDGHLRQLLGRTATTLVLDVGANHGQFGDVLRDPVGYRGRIESFEPAGAAFEVLTAHTAGDERWTAHHLALGSIDEVAQLRTFDSTDWNSFHAPDGEHLQRAGRSLVPTGSEEVPVRRLDGLWADLVRPDDVVLLKSDTQGHDLDVLAGAGERLQQVGALLLEASVLTFYVGEPDLATTIERVGEHGFSPSGVFPVTRRRGSLALDTVDVCFVPTPAAGDEASRG